MATWQYGLFGCFGDCGLCIKAYIIPCVVAGQTAEKAGQGSCMKCGIAALTPCGVYFMAKTREAVRTQKNIEGTFVNDCIMSWFCPLCSLIQVAREFEGPAATGQSMARV